MHRILFALLVLAPFIILPVNAPAQDADLRGYVTNTCSSQLTAFKLFVMKENEVSSAEAASDADRVVTRTLAKPTYDLRHVLLEAQKTTSIGDKLMACLARVTITGRIDGVPHASGEIGPSQPSASAAAGAGQCASTPDESLAKYNSDIKALIARYPMSPPTGSDGAKSVNQWSAFVGAEGLKILEPYRACLGPHYASNKAQLEAMRDTGVAACAKLSTTGQCVAEYPY